MILLLEAERENPAYFEAKDSKFDKGAETGKKKYLEKDGGAPVIVATFISMLMAGMYCKVKG